MTVAALVLAWCLPVVILQSAWQSAPPAGSTDSASERAAVRMRTLQQEADRLTAEERTLINELRQLEIDRQMRREEVAQATARQTAIEAELTGVAEQIARLEREEVAARPELRSRLVELYKLGQARYVRLFLSVSDIQRVGQASRLVATLAANDSERITSHSKRLAALKTSRTTLETRQRELADVRAEADKARIAADRAVNARNARIAAIDSQRDLNAQLAGELQAAQQKLQAALRGLAPGAPAPSPLPLRPFRGDLDWPASGAVRLRFGARAPGGEVSNGIEIGVLEGAPARAIHEGTVAFAGPFTGFANLVIVDHGGQSFSLYGNLMDVAVARDQRVARGESVGRVGPPVAGSAAELYFELRIDGRAVDPVEWLKKRY